MRDLLTDPLWQACELGRPIPDSPHAISVCLPAWADNVGYEEGEPRVIEAMQTGYPRFFFHPRCRELFAECRKRFGNAGEDALAFPTKKTARQFQRFLQDEGNTDSRTVPFGVADVHAVLFPQAAAETAKLGWQHCGGGVSSRLADACLTKGDIPDGIAAKATIRNRVADLAGVSTEDVWLFPCGMNAIATVQLALTQSTPDLRSVQFGFPYVDTLKLLEKIGPGAHFFPHGDGADLDKLAATLGTESVAAIYTEFPSNPLLKNPDLPRLHELARQHDVPLIVDDTVAGFFNVDLLAVADVVCTSLTKFFSGIGDVTAGSVVLNPKSPLYPKLRTALEAVYDDTLFAEDAIVLERNSRDYAERMPRINATAEKLTAWLAERPDVETVFAPQFQQPELYERFRKPGGGFGGLFSIVLKDAADTTPRFYDSLRVCKGPNLGMNYTLACPFTILAHYTELDFAESCGVSRWLVRVSVGLEDADDLIARFSEALTGVRNEAPSQNA